MVKAISFAILILFTPSLVSAQARLDEQQVRQVVINEIAWMGSPVEGVDVKQWWRYEWIVPQ